jgi:hypothetical protein
MTVLIPKTVLRCSSLPRAFACPPSVVGDALEVRVGGAEGEMGNAGHEAMTGVVDDEPLDLDAIGARWGTDRDELGRIVWYGRKVWEEIGRHFRAPLRREVALRVEIGDLTLVGHADLLDGGTDVVNGLDWKFGWLDLDYYDQVAGYATCLILAPRSQVREVRMTVVWARDQQVETYRFDRARCEAWVEGLRQRVLARPGAYRVGPQCTWCPRSHACEAMQARARQDVAIFGNVALRDQIAAGLENLPQEEVVSMLRRGKVVVTAYESFREAVRRLVETNGPIDSGDGHVVRIVEENGRRQIDTERAFNILKEEFTPKEMNQIFEARPSVMDEIAAKKAGRGNGAAAKRALQDRLVAAGAIEQKPVRKLVERRKPKGETE